MSNIQRSDIYLVNRHSTLSEEAVQAALEQHVYNDAAAWKRFLHRLLITLAVGFMVAGIVFFFAFNWAQLHKFAKIGLVQLLVIASTSAALLLNSKPVIRQVILTGAAVLVGVLFAVFGQVYDTGADAYDFFLAWTVCISLWVFVSHFAPLWLLYFVLINTTFVLYLQQVAIGWSELQQMTALFGINLAFLVAGILLTKRIGQEAMPVWLRNVLVLAATICGTICLVLGIFTNFDGTVLRSSLVVCSCFGLGIWYGLKIRSGFLLTVIAFGCIVACAGLLLKISDVYSMYLLVALFIIGSVSGVIHQMIQLQKKWHQDAQ